MTAVLLVVFAQFITVFLKGFQHKNVINDLYLHAGITSYLMATADVVVVGLIAKSIVIDSNWFVALGSGTGAAFGMVSAMYIHNRFFRKKEKTDGQVRHSNVAEVGKAAV